MAFIMPPDQFNSVPGLTESTTSMFSTRNFGDGLRMVYNTASAIKRTTSKAVSHPIFEKAIIQPLSRASTLPIIKEALVDPIKKLSENEHAMRIKESTDIFGRNLAEIIKPELFFERLEREEREGAGEIQVMERVAGSWSSEDSSALIKKKRPKKTHRRAREYLIGDEDTRSDYFSEGSEDPRISDIMFRENDMVREDEWKEASHQSMSKSFGKPKIRFAIEYDESSGDESDDGDEDVERQAKAIAPFNIYEAMKTPL